MRLQSAVLMMVLAAAPIVTFAQAAEQGVAADEQTLLKQVMTDKREVYAQTLGLTDSESRAFWPIYDEYEARVKKLDDRALALVNDYAKRYDSLSDADAANMLKEKMSIDDQRMSLKQSYTKKVAKALPAIKALRYAQVESRLDNIVGRNVYSLIPIAR
jgi:hypothetical protein